MDASGFLLSVGFITLDFVVAFERLLILLVHSQIDLLLGETYS